jgi:carbonic anhydrase
MSYVRDEVLNANAAYVADFGDKGKLALPPARRFAILTCMDARIDPAKLAGLREGDAHVIRNAGGRASDDAIRSLVISYKLLGTAEWFVIHHSNCGMELFTDEVIRSLLASSLSTSSYDGTAWKDNGKGPGSRHGDFHRLADHFRPGEECCAGCRTNSQPSSGARGIPIYGFIYQVETGKLVEVREATEIGKARG